VLKIYAGLMCVVPVHLPTCIVGRLHHPVPYLPYAFTPCPALTAPISSAPANCSSRSHLDCHSLVAFAGTASTVQCRISNIGIGRDRLCRDRANVTSLITFRYLFPIKPFISYATTRPYSVVPFPSSLVSSNHHYVYFLPFLLVRPRVPPTLAHFLSRTLPNSQHPVKSLYLTHIQPKLWSKA